MIKLKLKDGSFREVGQAMPASEIIKDIGMGLYKAASVSYTHLTLPTIRLV